MKNNKNVFIYLFIYLFIFVLTKQSMHLEKGPILFCAYKTI